VPWGRTEDGHETKLRSIVKTIVYRISVVIVIMIVARAVFLDSNWAAFLMASVKFVSHALTYFALERVFNQINWGRYTVEDTQTA
jgi:hypothetical protein